jgi:hypothetical protein
MVRLRKFAIYLGIAIGVILLTLFLYTILVHLVENSPSDTEFPVIPLKEEELSAIYYDLSPGWCKDYRMAYEEGKGCLNSDNAKLNKQALAQVESQEIDSVHCSVFAKYHHMRDYVTDKNESIAKQKLMDCYNQNREEFELLKNYSCYELFQKFEHGFNDIAWSDNVLKVKKKMDRCEDDEKYYANYGSCKTLSAQYFGGYDYLKESNKQAVEEKLINVCHYNLQEELKQRGK